MSLEYPRCLGWYYCHNICELCNGFYTDTSANTVITSPDTPINEEISEDDLDKATPERRMYCQSHYLHLSSSQPPPYRHHQPHARPATQAEGGAPASWFTDLQIQTPHWSTPGHVTLCQASDWWLWLTPNMLVMANFYCLIQDNLLLLSTVREEHGGLLSDSHSCSVLRV